MLVAAGGNAGNQAAVLVIAAARDGRDHGAIVRGYVLGELQMACCISIPMVAAGYLRVAFFQIHTTRLDAIAISASLVAIVFTSVVIGALLPLLLQRCHVDPAHAGATIQVIMDLLGWPLRARFAVICCRDAVVARMTTGPVFCQICAFLSKSRRNMRCPERRQHDARMTAQLITIAAFCPAY